MLAYAKATLPEYKPVSIKSALWAALVAFLVLRIVTGVVAVAAIKMRPLPPVAGTAGGVFDWYEDAVTAQGLIRELTEPWYRWDTVPYLKVAYDGGYTPNSHLTGYAPLYPFIVRLVAPLVGLDYLVAGILVSNISCFLLFALFHYLVARHYGTKIATWALVFYTIAPTAYYLVAAYAESLYLMLTIAAWLAVENKRYWVAGFFALLSTLARTQAFVLIFPFAYIAYVENYVALPNAMLSIQGLIQYYRQNIKELLLPLPALLGALIGMAIYQIGLPLLGYMSPTVVLKEYWHKYAVPVPFAALFWGIQRMLTHPISINEIINLSFFIVMAILCYFTIRYLRIPLSIYVFMTLNFLALFVHDDMALLNMPRYFVHIFPIFITLAILLSRTGTSAWKQLIRTLYIVVSIFLLFTFTALFAWYVWVS